MWKTLFLFVAIVAWPSVIAAAEIDFDRDIAPLLSRRCLSCHAGSEAEAKLDLTSHATTVAGGENGFALTPGNLEASLIWKRVVAGEMPEDNPLPDDERELLRRWIAGGAQWGTDPIDPFRFSSDSRAGYDWWSLQPLAVALPESTTPTDKHADKHADKQTRGSHARNSIDYFVLHQLNEAGVAPSKTATNRHLVRRVYFNLTGLPPSPDILQRIDDVEFENGGYERLVDELLASPRFGQRWARHWLDIVRYGESHGFEYNQPRNNFWQYRDWVINALNEDVSYIDFVRLQLAGDVLRPDDATAWPATGFIVAGPHNTTKPSGQKMRMTMRHDELEDMVGAIGQTFLGLTVNCARCHDHKFDPITQKEYYQLVATMVGVDHGERDMPGGGKMYTAISREAPKVSRLRRGDVSLPAETVQPAGLRAVNAALADFGLADEAKDDVRRKRLADWVTGNQNPLLARVIVNRLWQFHFGQGLVRTPSDFGFNGDRPSHPKLLDYLAGELIRNDWQLKPIHRLIMNSATYRQASRLRPAAASVDADNRLLWRFSPRRMTAEEIRDSMLCVADQLDDSHGGPSYRDVREYKYRGSHYYDPIEPVGIDAVRRTVYRFSPRGAKRTILDTFDCPDPSAKAPKRTVTITPLQALSLMNNQFVLQTSANLASRLESEHDRAADRIQTLYQLVYGRTPSDRETQSASRFIHDQDLAAFCRVIFNSNEFLHVR